MRRFAVLAGLDVLAACHHAPPVERIATPPPGITMAFYQAAGTSYTVVDDRREVEIVDGMLVLDYIDPGAALPSLVIEPLGASTLVVGQCARAHETHALPPEQALERFGAWQERRRKKLAEGDPDAEPEAAPDANLTIVSPVVRCAATGQRGKQLVRVLYVSSGLGYHAQHEITMTAGDRAVISTRFSIAAPPWGGRADVVLFEGTPGGDKPPVEVARGSLALDGSTAVLGAPPRETPAHIRRVFDGAVHAPTVGTDDPSWGREAVHAVWVWLELDHVALPMGPTHAHIALPGESIRDIDVPSGGRQETKAGTRLPVWIDDQLRGLRVKTVQAADGASLADRFSIAVSNLGTEPREVWIEEKLRPAKRRAIKAGWPAKPQLGGELARTKVMVGAGATERVGYVIEYEF